MKNHTLPFKLLCSVKYLTQFVLILSNSLIKLIIIFIFILLYVHYSKAQPDSALIKIYFSEGHHSLSDAYSKILHSYIKNIEEYKNISIIGRCDKHGNHALNDSLSYLRAKAVKDYLIANGFPPENINLVAGLGKRSPIEPNFPYTDSLNRVVWITMPSNTLQEPLRSIKIKSYSSKDSIVILFPPYDSKYLVKHQSPQLGDTLHIDTSIKQLDDVLFITRIIYIAEGFFTSLKENISSYALVDTLIRVFPPFSAEDLIRSKKPYKGDTLRIDTTMIQSNHFLTINRKIFIADDSTRFLYSLTPKEIPEKTKTKAIKQAVLDTLEKSVAGDAIIIRDLSFEFGYHAMPTSDLPALEALETAFKKWPYLKLEIQSHLCCGEIGKEGYDKQTSQYELSQNRAKEIYDFFVTRGVDKTRIFYKGYGMEKPLVPNEKDKEDQYRNRRIEFLILDK